MDAFWIGMNDIVHEMSFVWDDYVVPTFAYWGKQQPDDVFGRDCLILQNLFVFLKNWHAPEQIRKIWILFRFTSQKVQAL